MQQQTVNGAGGRRQTALVTCPKSMVGRVIGRSGETIKALQTYTGALIQIDQTCDPTKIAISGTPQNLNLALSMVHDIVRGTFKGFALLRQATGHSSRGPQQIASRPVYAPGYGLIPPSQLYGSGDTAVMLHATAAGSGGGGFLSPRGLPAAGGALPGTATYAPMLGAAGPLGAGPRPLVLGMQPIQLQGAALHSPAVYNMMGGPVYFSPLDYSGASATHMSHLAGSGAGGGAPEMVFYSSDGTTPLMATSAVHSAAAAATGSRLFHSVGSAMTHPAVIATTGGAASGGAEVVVTSAAAPSSYGSSAAGGGASRGGPTGGGTGVGAGAGLLHGGNLVMDADGAIYTTYH